MSLLFMFFSAIVSQADICPNLNGQYNCSLGSHRFSLQVESQDKTFLVVKDGRGMKYEANSKEYKIPDTDSFQNGVYRSKCEKNKLRVDFSVELLYEGSVIGRQKSVTNYEKIKSDLIITEKTRVKGVSLPTQRFVCHIQ